MKKAIYFIFALIILAIPSGVTHAQSANESKARAYFFSAQEYFAARDYVNALTYLQSAENLLGKSNARIEALRAQSLHHKGDIEGAKRSLDLFFGYSPSASLTREMAAYTREIESRFEANKARIAADRRAQAEKDRQARIAALERAAAAEQRAKEAAAAARKRQQEQAERDVVRQKMRRLIADIQAPCVNVEKCQEAIGQNWADNLGLYTKATKENNPQRKQELIVQYADYLQRERLLYWKKCKLGAIDSCHYYAGSLINAASWIAKNKSIKDRFNLMSAQEEVLAGKNCTSSDLVACHNKNVLEMYKLSCDSGYADSCVPYAHNWKTVTAMKLETYRTKADIQKKGCSLKSATSCRNLFVDIFSKTRRWSIESIRFAQRACDYGDSYSCLELAKDNRRGTRGVKKKKSVAKSLYDKYCAIKKIDQKQCKKDYRKL